MAKNKQRKNQKIMKRVRKHTVAMFDDAIGIMRAAGNPQRMWKVLRKTMRRRPALSAAAALITAASLWLKRDDEQGDGELGAAT